MKRGNRIITYLVDDFIPFLTTDSNLDGFLHQTSRYNNAMKLMSDAPGGFCNL